MKDVDKVKKLNELFGSYRAEWLKGKIYDFFTEPSYFTALKDNRPCVLQGGRGTGKTTVLKGLSYQGQFALHNKSIEKFDASDFIGIYHRANTNHVRAFIGGNLTSEKWQKIFGHYFNLIICREILMFIDWHKKLSPKDDNLSSHICNLIAKSVFIEGPCDNLIELLELFETKMYEFQAQINNIVDYNLPNLSMCGDPLKIVTENAVSLYQFKNKVFYILLDEYENFENNQQQILNTLIKHNTENYTFKIGVRELGWRIKHTLNKEELLHDPADYVLINIEQKLTEESHFSDFAKNVCQPRIIQLFSGEEDFDYSIEKSLESLSIEEEAKLLNVESTDLMKGYSKLSNDYKKNLKKITPLYRYFIAYWAKCHNMTLLDAVSDYFLNIERWNTRYDNYKYNMLFKIRKGRGMSGIQKYYAGWNTYVKLANGNIRYLMELVYRAYEKHLNSIHDLTHPVSFEDQTEAAKEVGLKNLMELEGLWKNGPQLTKLLLGFGRIFNVLASEEGKIRPEVDQFSLEGNISKECDEIITAAVMNLALVRIPGNKLSEQSNTRDYIYSIHPIFAPYFVFSYRKKRKINVSDGELMGLISNPRDFIKSILAKSKISESSNNELPSQLNLFEEFYND